jgi:hypothetical protein
LSENDKNMEDKKWMQVQAKVISEEAKDCG